MEYFDPSYGRAGWGGLAGLSMYGGVGRDAQYLKHSSVCFDQTDGPSYISANLFGDGYLPDRLILRQRIQQLLCVVWHRPQFIIDQWTRDALTALGTQNTPGFGSTFRQRTLLGDLRRLAHIDNRLRRHFFGGLRRTTLSTTGVVSSFDVVSTTTGWQSMQASGRPVQRGKVRKRRRQRDGQPTVLADPTAYALMAQYLNLPDFCDYIITNYYGGNWDWDWHNYSALYAPPDPPLGDFDIPDSDTEGNLLSAADGTSPATSPVATPPATRRNSSWN